MAEDNRSDSISPLIEFERSVESLEPFKEALCVMEKNTHFAELLDSSNVDRIGEMNRALTQGLFDESLSKAVSDMLAPIRDLLSTQTALAALRDVGVPMIKPEIYKTIQNTIVPTQNLHFDMSGITSALQPVLRSLPQIDTSWLQGDNSWLTTKSVLASIDTSSISGMTGTFAKLCRLEQETSLIPTAPDTLISVSSQIASIMASITPYIPLDNLFASNSLLADYCDLASKQYFSIQRSIDKTEIDWRVGVLDAASKYVDRQVTWTRGDCRQAC